jgi:hypothetical protein
MSVKLYKTAPGGGSGGRAAPPPAKSPPPPPAKKSTPPPPAPTPPAEVSAGPLFIDTDSASDHTTSQWKGGVKN